jgi:hypothetical protein
MAQIVQSGFELFRHAIEIDQMMKVVTVNHLDTPQVSIIEISGLGKTVNIAISDDFFDHLPSILDYKNAVDSYVRHLRMRIQNFSPYYFYCRSGLPIHIALSWPFAGWPDGDASFINARVQCLQQPTSEGLCSVTIYFKGAEWDVKKVPFVRERLVINRVRDALDAKELLLGNYEPHEEPAPELKIKKADQKTIVPASNEELERFLLAKVFWLGFQCGDQNTRTWIADPWDAEYLAVKSKDLIRTAEILNAREEIVLDGHGEFAWAGKALLARGGLPQVPSEDRESPLSKIPPEPSMAWDVFISHASEDKDSFVRPLAEALRKYGLNVWYDEFTLKIGDHLRRSIDRGLSQSKYGIVVMSPDFFAKQWTQVELDGLVALEMNSPKIILPIWHKVEIQDVRRYSATLSDRVAAKSNQGINVVVEQLLDAMGFAKGKVGVASENIQASEHDKLGKRASASAPQKIAGTEVTDSELDRMATLLSEMRTDLKSPDAEFVREFFVLPNKRVWLGGSSKPRFTYYESDHQNLRGMLDVLEERGYVVDVTPLGNNAPIYRMTEKLMKYLRDQ